MSKQSQSQKSSSPVPTPGTPQPLVTRRAWLGVTALGAVGVIVGSRFLRATDDLTAVAPSSGAGAAAVTGEATLASDVMVYKSPTCGCCEKWIEHMEKNGFAVRFEDMDNVVPIKQRLGVPQDLWSCHTSVIGEYTFEGHVPADLVRKVLAEKPRASGLAVPGMPPASPGMDQGNAPYEVKLFTRDGKITLYATR